MALPSFLPFGYALCAIAHARRRTRPAADESTQRRAFLLFFGFGCVSAALQNAEAARLAAAVVRTRAELATVFAPLSHMLRNGFFLVQGFFMSASIERMSSGHAMAIPEHS
ncbi:hypothetical protein [Paraburkholderia youngii]|uniref:Uncharacterized protein n=1 Tax=Paraburkholderia youngii TaxID=2782701 RepID=A0A7W8P7K4_9BURK|nr:hypothetical protein [Paraburkholderia youngii]MBB5405240.1 hypothetical protein [Paraburkholderia youngii]